METLNATDKLKKDLDENANLDEIEEEIQRYESDDFKQKKAAEIVKRPLYSKISTEKKKSSVIEKDKIRIEWNNKYDEVSEQTEL